MKQLAIIPLYHGDRPYRMVRKDVSGYFIPLLGYPFLRIKGLYHKR